MKLISIFYILLTNFINVDEIKSGMEGYGLTVFEGTKIDTFNVKVIDIMKNAIPKGDIILVKIYGKKIDTAGVIAGMSGSPIYINNKLAGALAYNFSIFGKEAIAGVTPIKEMISPTSLGYIPKDTKIGSGYQIKYPFYCYGLPNQVLSELKDNLPFLLPIENYISGISSDSIIPQPGSVLGIPLVIGDLNWFVMGTCTYVEDKKIYGFGHTFGLLGKTEFPMTSGYVYSIVTSYLMSYKLSTSTKIIGSIKEDNDRGIIGIVGEIPDMIECNFFINKEKFNYKIVKERIFLPLLFRGLLFYSTSVGFKGSGEATMDINMKIGGTQNFDYKDKFSGEIYTIAKSISEVFQMICNNVFGKIDIKDISLQATANDTIKLAKITDIYINKNKVYPGDTLNLIIYLLTYREGIKTKNLSIIIPKGIDKGDIFINVEGGDHFRRKFVSNITNINQLKDWISSSPKNNELVITINQKDKEFYFLGEKFSYLPLSISSFKNENKSVSIDKGIGIIFKKIIPTDWIILESKSIKLQVL